MFLVLIFFFFCPSTFFYRVETATTALVLLKETRRTINACSCLFMFSNTLLTQRECLHALYTLTLARHGLLSSFNQRPSCTGNQCNRRLSASAASRVLRKKKSLFKFLLFLPILLLWLSAYYYWQYFNVYGCLSPFRQRHKSWRTLTCVSFHHV